MNFRLPAPFLLLLSALAGPLAFAGEPAPAAKEPAPVSVKFGGLIQVQADGGDQGDSRFPSDDLRFYLRRGRLIATAKFPEGFEARVEAELAGSLAAAASLRGQLNDAFVGWTRLPQVQVRAGQLKTPYGYEQLLSDLRMTAMERTLGNDRLNVGRQVGLLVSGDLLGTRLSYAAGAFNGSGVNTTSNGDGNLLVAGRVSGSPWKGSLAGADATLSAGLDGFSSDDTNLLLSADFGFDSTPATPAADNLFTGRRRGAGADLQFVAGRVEILSEALRVRFEPVSGVPDPSFDATSVFLQAGYEVLARKLQLFAKVDRFDPNGERDGDATKTLTLGGNWFLRGHDLKLQANYLGSDVPGLPRQHKVLARIQAAF